MNGISSAEFTDHVSEEGGSSVNEYDKRVIDQAQEIRELLSSNSDQSKERLKQNYEDPASNKSDKTVKKNVKTTAVTAANRQVGINDFKHDLAEKFSNKSLDKMQQKIHKNLDSHLKEQLSDWLENPLHHDISFHDHVQVKSLKHKVKSKTTPSNSKVMLRSDIASILSNPLLNQQLRQKNIKKSTSAYKAFTNPKTSGSANEHLQQYAALFAKSLFQKEKPLKQSLQQSRSAIVSEGVDERRIISIEKGVKAFMAKELKKQLKTHFFETFLYYDAELAKKGLIPQSALNQYEFFKKVIEKNRFSDKQNHFEIQLIREDVRQELRQFIANELDRILVESRLESTDISLLSDKMDTYNSAIRNAGFNAPEYVSLINQKLDTFGLIPIKLPYSMGFIDNDLQRQKKDRFTDSAIFNGDSDEDKTRSMFYQLYTCPSLFKRIKLHYNLHQHKKQQTPEQLATWEKLKQQAKKHAIFSLLSKLKHLFEERSLFPECKGDHFNFVQSEITETVRQLHHIGHHVSKDDLTHIRDEANRRLFPSIKERYLLALANAKSQPDSVIIVKESSDLYKVLMRLKEESKILESIEPMLFNMGSLQKRQVSEAA